jgi:hypothetical protein
MIHQKCAAKNLGFSLQKWDKVAFCKSTSTTNQTTLFQNKKGGNALSARIVCMALWTQYIFPPKIWRQVLLRSLGHKQNGGLLLIGHDD